VIGARRHFPGKPRERLFLMGKGWGRELIGMCFVTGCGYVFVITHTFLLLAFQTQTVSLGQTRQAGEQPGFPLALNTFMSTIHNGYPIILDYLFARSRYYKRLTYLGTKFYD
jgi:hypothetical protein